MTIDGVVWAPVNCGYDATHKAGLLYQWGRKYGQAIDAENITYQDVSDGKMTLADGNKEEKKNTIFTKEQSWYQGPDATTLWPAEYDPCPDGWRVPTESEMSGLIAHCSEKTTVGDYSGYYFSGSNEYSQTVPSVFFQLAGRRGYGATAE